MHTCIDLFAGPGGLGEGFSRAGFELAVSIEKEPVECETLRHRKLYKKLVLSKDVSAALQLESGEMEFTDFEESHPELIRQVNEEVAQIELGRVPFSTVYDKISKALHNRKSSALILLGGPPCQAYSIVGRARKVGHTSLEKNPNLLEEFYKDQRHTLYKEYLKVLSVFSPEIFIMENVKGILSARTNPGAKAGSVIEKIFADLRAPAKSVMEDQNFTDEIKRLNLKIKPTEYILFPLPPNGRTDLFSNSDIDFSKEDFTIRSEKFNIPQTRHRVIVCGVRADIFKKLGRPSVLKETKSYTTVRDIIGSLPKIRSEITKEKVLPENWADRVKREISDLTSLNEINISKGCKAVECPNEAKIEGNVGLSEFIEDSLGKITNHKTRKHMASDLARYYFCADFAEKEGRSPRIEDWPLGNLIPNHADIKKTGNRPSASSFSDRFKVQLWDKPGSTVTSHISKDGHYFIHPDKTQCRSLSVREAARIQTFPDSYQFCGGISKQFHQIGNAVPPYLAYQIAQIIKSYLEAK